MSKKHRSYLTDGPDPRLLWTSPPELSSCVGTMVGECDPFHKCLLVVVFSSTSHSLQCMWDLTVVFLTLFRVGPRQAPPPFFCYRCWILIRMIALIHGSCLLDHVTKSLGLCGGLLGHQVPSTALQTQDLRVLPMLGPPGWARAVRGFPDWDTLPLSRPEGLPVLGYPLNHHAFSECTSSR